MSFQFSPRILPQSWLFWSAICAETTLAAFAIVLTLKRSLTRRVVNLVLTLLVCTEISLLPSLGGPPVLKGLLSFFILLKACHLASIFAVIGIELRDHIDYATLRNSRIIPQLLAASGLVFSFRGIGTPWEIKILKAQAQPHATPPTRSRCLLRRAARVLLQIFAVDLIFFGYIDSHQRWKPQVFDFETEFLGPNTTAEQLIARSHLCIVGIVGLAMLIDLAHGLLAITFIATGLTSCAQWPPAFGRISDAYTVRRFWAKTWHQFLRWPTLSVSTCVRRHLRRVIQLPPLADQLLSLIMVFSLSGFFHQAAAVYTDVPGSLVGISSFFMISPLAMLFEEGAQRVYCEVLVPRLGWRVPRHCGYLLGYLWTYLCIYLFAPWFLFPIFRLPLDRDHLGDYSVTKAFGATATGALIALAGLGVRYASW
ncbi:wax synthase family protein [Aspergillus mulundensis]|uniref:Wax synthase domain-containing protein n=1 Tax=Aspergillus mulundensis TaxID=1810919 RepID=A0A3D8T6L3_9EURO|nr:hypothetical protein DSM5745_01393 [Aspergillus mulundensis]RDW94071.1 hypothetical protein DSM5745_01393 [Aspergillus mulundensis]